MFFCLLPRWFSKFNTPRRPLAGPCWCRWTRSPGTTVSCFDIGVLDYDSTPLSVGSGLKKLRYPNCGNPQKIGYCFRSVRKNYRVDANVVAEYLKNRRITSNAVRYGTPYIRIVHFVMSQKTDITTFPETYSTLPTPSNIKKGKPKFPAN